MGYSDLWFLLSWRHSHGSGGWEEDLKQKHGDVSREPRSVQQEAPVTVSQTRDVSYQDDLVGVTTGFRCARAEAWNPELTGC